MSAASSSNPGRIDIAELRGLWDSGQHGRAIRGVLQNWDVLLASNDELRWLEPVLRSNGLPAEATALQVRGVRRQRGDAAAWERLIRSVMQSGDLWWAAELAREAGGQSRALRALHIESELAAGNREVTELVEHWLRQGDDEASREMAVTWLVRSGQIDAAQRLVEGATAPSVWAARLALWRGRPEPARGLIERLAPTPETRCLEGVALMLEGAFAQAELVFRSLLESDVRNEAGAWLVTALRKQGRYDEAVAASESASYASTEFYLVPRVERQLAVAYAEAANRSRFRLAMQAVMHWLRPGRKPEHAATLREYALALRALGLHPEDPLEKLDAGLERLAGNHSQYLTMTDDAGRLTACNLPPNARHLAASIQMALWTRGVDAVRALYRSLATRVDSDSHFRIYEGEFELWMGAYEDAARIFRDAIDRDRETRWAWIGLGASAMLQGDLREAQAVWKKGLAITRFAGPTLYIYRGECYRRQGEIDHARQDLEEALRMKPERLSAQINLALLAGDREKLERAEQACIAHAPLLMQELTGSVPERLEKVLDAMRGNRSSSSWHVSYHLWDRVWRRPP